MHAPRLFLLFSALVLTCCPAAHAQVEWSKTASDPVLDVGSEGSWDAGVVFEHYVIQRGDTLKMWYSGNNVGTALANDFGIGYAWSLDGITWTKVAENPVMTGRAGAWDDVGVAAPVVIQDGDTLRMWYHGVTDTGAVPGRFTGYATSVDGITWDRRDTPVFEAGSPGQWDGDILITHAVIKEDDGFKMWYSGGVGAPPNVNFRTGYATSPDGIHWTKYDDSATTSAPFQSSDPVVERGSVGTFDDGRAWAPHVLKTASGYEMWYAGAGSVNGFNQVVMYATSVDGIHWTKHAENPVFQGPLWWTNDIVNPRVIVDGGQYRMWFTGFAPAFPFPARIGYASASVATAVEEAAPGIPAAFTLHQSYPNPFNPGTTISYQLVRSEHVVLTVYDVLGRAVRTLLDGVQQAGGHTVVWDGTDDGRHPVPTGLYVYRMQAGRHIASRKMLLTK